MAGRVWGRRETPAPHTLLVPTSGLVVTSAAPSDRAILSLRSHDTSLARREGYREFRRRLPPRRAVGDNAGSAVASRLDAWAIRLSGSENIAREASRPGFSHLVARRPLSVGRTPPMIHRCLWGDRPDGQSVPDGTKAFPVRGRTYAWVSAPREEPCAIFPYGGGPVGILRRGDL